MNGAITKLAPTERATKVFSNYHSNGVEFIKNSYGEYTSSHNETNRLLLQTYSLGCKTVDEEE